MIVDSSKPSKLRKCIHHKKHDEERHHPKTENLTMSKSKSSHLSYIFEETNPFATERCKSKNGASVLALFNCSSGG